MSQKIKPWLQKRKDDESFISIESLLKNLALAVVVAAVVAEVAGLVVVVVVAGREGDGGVVIV